MEAAASRTTLCALPLALLQSVLARLPVDARARACVVCRAWSAALAERSLWARLDLSPASGMAVAVTDELLRAAAARANGQLEALDLSDCDVSCYAVLAVVTASAATMHELRWCDNPSTSSEERAELASVHIEELLRAAPQLRVFDVDAECGTVAEASRLLRNEPPYAPLRVHALTVNGLEDDAPDEAAVLALATAVAGHAWLAELTFVGMPLNTAAVLDVLVDAALARRLRAVRLVRCQLSPESAPALARLLGGGLAELAIVSLHPQLDLNAAVLLSNALRASTTLTSCRLCEGGLWDDPAAAVLLLGALTSHQSLCELCVWDNAADTPAMQAIAGALLATLVAANAPALHTLDISQCSLGDTGMGLLVDALARNNHLRTLECAGNEITEGFMRNRLRPAVQANAALRKLILIDDEEEDDDDETAHPAIMLELQDLVAARGGAGAPQ
jgi:hypothetical protein